VDAGEGTDTIRVRFAENTEVTLPVTVPASFERLGLAPETGVTATLSPSFDHVGTVQVSGSGNADQPRPPAGDGSGAGGG
jgi:hypothetical protein